MRRRDKFFVLGMALALDRLAGEPPERVHPVVWVGYAISFLADRAPGGRRARLAYGALCAALPGGGAALVAVLLPRVVRAPWLRLPLEAWLFKSCFAHRALEEAAVAVAEPLERRDLVSAREALVALVSRDRSTLDASQVAAATVESLAENLSDSFAAPLLAYAVGGLPAAFLYRAANTADAMIGYREGRYEHLGKVSARLDDALNFLPARLTALALVAASGRSARGSVSVLLRDCALTQSPNAGRPMSAAAGALGISLEKPGHYVLNGRARRPGADDIRRAVSHCRRAAALCTALACAVMLLWRSP